MIIFLQLETLIFYVDDILQYIEALQNLFDIVIKCNQV